MDIALAYDAEALLFDLVLAGDGAVRDLEGDDGLLTAVIISLFTDARAREDDALPDERVGVPSDLRGWWGDHVAAPEAGGAQARQPSLGSRLWLLWREKDLDSVIARAQEYAEEALAWLTAEGWATGVTVTARRVAPRYLGIGVGVLPEGQQGAPGREWNFVYDYQAARLVGLSGR